MHMTASLTLWLVEDDRRYRDTLVSVLDAAPGMACARTFGDVEALVEAAGAAADDPEAETPDVVLLDVHLPGQTGIAALPDLRATLPEAALVILTVSENPSLIFEAFRAGASGYLVKDAPVDDLLEAVRQAAAGGTLMPAAVASHVLQHFRQEPPSSYNLTPREQEVLELMTEGLSQREIAERLFVSPHTVNTHVQHLYAKLQVHSGIEAVVKAVREKLV